MLRRPIYKHAGIIVKSLEGKGRKEKEKRKPLPNKQSKQFYCYPMGMRQKTNIFVPLPQWVDVCVNNLSHVDPIQFKTKDSCVTRKEADGIVRRVHHIVACLDFHQFYENLINYSKYRNLQPHKVSKLQNTYLINNLN